MFRLSVYCCAAIVGVVRSLQVEDDPAATAAAGHLARPEARAETASWAHAMTHTRADSAAQSQSTTQDGHVCEDTRFGPSNKKTSMLRRVGGGSTLE